MSAEGGHPAQAEDAAIAVAAGSARRQRRRARVVGAAALAAAVMACVYLGAVLNASRLNSRLLNAVENGRAAEVGRLLAAGADPNATLRRDDRSLGALLRRLWRLGSANDREWESALRPGATPAVVLAAIHGHEDVLAALLAGGADVNAKTKDGNTALMMAAFGADPKMILLLLRAGAPIDTRNRSGKTALLMASEQQAEQPANAAMRRLLAWGADPNAPDAAGWTPLLNAAAANNLGGVHILLASGAVPTKVNRLGQSPLSWARYHHNGAMVRILLRARKGVRQDIGHH